MDFDVPWTHLRLLLSLYLLFVQMSLSSWVRTKQTRVVKSFQITLMHLIFTQESVSNTVLIGSLPYDVVTIYSWKLIEDVCYALVSKYVQMNSIYWMRTWLNSNEVQDIWPIVLCISTRMLHDFLAKLCLTDLWKCQCHNTCAHVINLSVI